MARFAWACSMFCWSSVSAVFSYLLGAFQLQLASDQVALHVGHLEFRKYLAGLHRVTVLDEHPPLIPVRRS